MRVVSAALLALAAGFGIALLALAVFHTTTVGNCASGPVPYEIANPCPPNTGWWFGALFAGIAVTGVALALVGGGLTTGVIFLTVGGACVAALATGDAQTSWLVAAIVLALVFLPLGGWMLWLLPRTRLRRALALVPAAAVGAIGGVAVVLAIPGPLEEPKQTTAASDATSWFRADTVNSDFADVVKQLGPAVGVRDISLQPGALVITVLVGGKRHDLHYGAGTSVQDYISAAASGDRTVALTAIDTAAPTRMVTELRRRFGIGPARLQSIYFGINPVTGAAYWYANLQHTTVYFQGGSQGTGLKRVSS